MEAVVDEFETSDRPLLALPDIAEVTGFSLSEVGKACINLQKAGHLELITAMSGNDYSPWSVKEISSSALVATGAWPSPESLAAAIVEELIGKPDVPDIGGQKGWLKILSGAGGVSREVFTQVLTDAVRRVLTPGS